jgi:hypothetical protein
MFIKKNLLNTEKKFQIYLQGADIYCTNLLAALSSVAKGIDHNRVFTMTQHLPVGQVLLIIEDSRLHSDTRHSLGILWTSDQTDAETST